MIDEEYTVFCSAVLCVVRIHSGRLMFLQVSFPAREQFSAVLNLVGFCALRDVGARGDSFKVNDDRHWLIDHPIPLLANLQRQVGVFALRWQVVLIKAP